MIDLRHNCITDAVWPYFRERRIVADHQRVASICENLITGCVTSSGMTVEAVRELDTEKVIWQYWAQGFDSAPDVVLECAASVDKYKGDYTVVRLTDDNFSDYVKFPDSLLQKLPGISKAHFSDILRVALLSLYGGIWLDATVLLTDYIPVEYSEADFFVFQRDPEEPHKKYWRNVYAYYFGWNRKFRVNMLSSFMVSKKGGVIVSLLCAALLSWWKDNDWLPHYFFLQILFDVAVKGKCSELNCPIVSDCLPHYMQQSINDQSFNLAAKSEIEGLVSIHKLTYK